MKLKELLLRYRSVENSTSSFTMKEIEDIGVFDKEVLTKNPKFKNAVMLVATRRGNMSCPKKSANVGLRTTGYHFTGLQAS